MEMQEGEDEHSIAGCDTSYKGSHQEAHVEYSHHARLQASRSTSNCSYMCPEDAPYGVSTATVESYGLDGLCGNTFVCEPSTPPTSLPHTLPAPGAASLSGRPVRRGHPDSAGVMASTQPGCGDATGQGSPGTATLGCMGGSMPHGLLSTRGVVGEPGMSAGHADVSGGSRAGATPPSPQRGRQGPQGQAPGTSGSDLGHSRNAASADASSGTAGAGSGGGVRRGSSYYQGRRLSKEMFSGLDAEAGVHFDVVVFVKEVIYHLFHPLSLPLVWYLEGGKHGVRNRKFWWQAGGGSQAFVLSQMVLGACFFAMNGLCFAFWDLSTYVIVMVNVQWLIRNMVVGAKYAFTPPVEMKAMARGRVPNTVLRHRMITVGWTDPLPPAVIKRQLLLAAVRNRLTLSSAAFVLPPRTPSAPMVAMMQQLLAQDSDGDDDGSARGGAKVESGRRPSAETVVGVGVNSHAVSGGDGDAGNRDDDTDVDGEGGGGADAGTDVSGGDDSDRDDGSSNDSSQGGHLGHGQGEGEGESTGAAASGSLVGQRAVPNDGNNLDDGCGNTHGGSGGADGGGDGEGSIGGVEDLSSAVNVTCGGRGVAGHAGNGKVGKPPTGQHSPDANSCGAHSHGDQAGRPPVGLAIGDETRQQRNQVRGRQQAGEGLGVDDSAWVQRITGRGEELSSVTVDGMGPLLVDMGGGKMVGFPFVGLTNGSALDADMDYAAAAADADDDDDDDDDGGGPVTAQQGGGQGEGRAGTVPVDGATAGSKQVDPSTLLPRGPGGSSGPECIQGRSKAGREGGLGMSNGEGKEPSRGGVAALTSLAPTAHYHPAGASHSTLQASGPGTAPLGTAAATSHPLGFLSSLRWLLLGRSSGHAGGPAPPGVSATITFPNTAHVAMPPGRAPSKPRRRGSLRCSKRRRRLEQEWMDSCAAGCGEGENVADGSTTTALAAANAKQPPRGKSSKRAARHKSGSGSKKPTRVLRPAAAFSHHLPVRLFAAHLIRCSSDVTRRTHLVHSFISRHSDATCLVLALAYVTMPFVGQVIDGHPFSAEHAAILALSSVLSWFSIFSNMAFMCIGVMDIRRRLWLAQTLSRLLMDNHRRVPGAFSSAPPCVTKEGVVLPDCGKGPAVALSPKTPSGTGPAGMDASTAQAPSMGGSAAEPLANGLPSWEASISGLHVPQGAAQGETGAGAVVGRPVQNGHGTDQPLPHPTPALLAKRDPLVMSAGNAGGVREAAGAMATVVPAPAIPVSQASAPAGAPASLASQPVSPTRTGKDVPRSAESGFIRVPIDLTKPESLLAWWVLRQLLQDFGRGFFARVKFYTSLFALFCLLLVGFLLGKLLTQGTVDMAITLVVVYNVIVFAVLLSLMVWPGGAVNAANVGHEADLLELKMGLSLKLRSEQDMLAAQEVDDVTAAIDMLDAILALVRESNAQNLITIVGLAAGEQMIGALLAVGATGIAIAAEQLVNIFSS